MSTTESQYTAHFRLRHLIERDRTQLIQCPTFLDGAASAPTSGTVSIFKPNQGPDDTAEISAQAVTITSSVAEYSVTFGTGANQIESDAALGEGWRVEWVLLMPDSITHTFRNDASLVRRRLYPVITDQDLDRTHPGLTGLLPSGQTHWQDQIDEAWFDLQRMLIAKGNRPELVMEPTALYDAHLTRTLYRMFRLLKTRMGVDSQYAELAEEYLRDFNTAWGDLNFKYDDDDSGRSESNKDRRPAQPQVFLQSNGHYRSGY